MIIQLLILLNIVLYINSVTVDTTYGSISGILNEFYPTVEMFLGIPYAKVPVGNLRWKKPSPIEAWKTQLNASSFGPKCIQQYLPAEEINEDCLYLNIYRPNNQGNNLPVMIWIHGGAFIIGAGSEFDGSWFAQKGVILVTFNYRLNIFGFAVAHNHGLSGNYGLLDQHEAIVFTKKIIPAFGGNPNNINIFGESAGAGSVVFHLMSPLSKGLVQRGISQSFYPYYQNTSIGENNLRVICALFPNCLQTANIDTIVNFLQQVSSNDIVEVLPFVSFPFLLQFGPTPHDGIFFPIDVRDTMTSKLITCYPFIGGWNNLDGIIFPTIDGSTFKNFNLNSKSGIAPQRLNDFISFQLNEYQRKILYEHYAKMDSDRRFIDFYTDNVFAVPILQFADVLVSSGCTDTYIYRFSYNTPSKKFSTVFYGATHEDELQYMFANPSAAEKFNTEENELSNMFLSYWSEFSYGRTLKGWPLYDTQRNIYAVTTVKNTSILHDYNARKFWIKTKSTKKPIAKSKAIDAHPMFVLYSLIILIIINYSSLVV